MVPVGIAAVDFVFAPRRRRLREFWDALPKNGVSPVSSLQCYYFVRSWHFRSQRNKGVSDLHLKSVLDTKLGNLYPSQRLEEPLDADCTPEDPPDEDGVPLTPYPTCNMSSSHLGSLPYSLSDLSDLKPERRLSTFSSFKSYVEHTLKRRL